MTQVGVILGTAAYMSPEQAKGRAADKRSDLWAFGCVLYEMLTGRTAFAGDDVADTLAFVLTKSPDWGALPANTPTRIVTLLRRCLEKDRRRRLADAVSVRLEIDDALAEPQLPHAAAASTLSSPRTLAWAAGAFTLGVAITAGAAWIWQPVAPAPLVFRSEMTLPPDQALIEYGHQLIAMSSDGRSIAYIANRRIYLRSMSEPDARPLAGTETFGQIGGLVFSPDGQSIAFFSGGGISGARDLRTIPVSGGVATTLCSGCVQGGRMSWDRSGIVFTSSRPSGSGVARLSPSGGEPELLLTAEGLIYGAQLLPDGESVLFTYLPRAFDPVALPTADDWDKAQIVVQSLKTTNARKVVIDGGAAQYVSSGYVVYARGGVLYASPFDVRRREVTGAAVAVVEGVRRPTGGQLGVVYFDVAASGSLVFLRGPVTTALQNDLAIVDSERGLSPLRLPVNAYVSPRLSPDGKWLAVGTDNGREANVSVYALAGSTAIRQLTTDGKSRFPIWSPDSQRVTFQSDRNGRRAIYSQLAAGSRDAEPLTTPDPDTEHVPDAWSPDGQFLLYEVIRNQRRTLWAWSAKERKAQRVGDVEQSFPFDASIAPGGRWIAHRYPTSKGSSVGVLSLPTPGVPFLIGPGVHPVWSPDGKTLMYRQLSTGEFLTVDVTLAPAFTFTAPRQLPMTLNERVGNAGRRNYDLLPDGRRFLGVNPVGNGPQGTQIEVVLNWSEELKQRVPTR
jgi:Tol biopolymer transport system component